MDVNPKDIVGAQKAPLKLVPPAAIIGMADGLSVGAKKYGAYNWREQPIEVMTYIEAAYRHLMAFADGEDYSQDTEEVVGHPVHHIDHALAGLGILRDALTSGKVVDNRPPKGPASELLKQMDRSIAIAPLTIVSDGETRFLCGHKVGEAPELVEPRCGTAIHWAPDKGIKRIVQ